MSIQQSEVDGLTVVPAPAPSAWFPGSPELGLDGRLELAILDSANQVAVREVRYPNGPALLLSVPEWNRLLGLGAELVDLR